MRLLLTSAGLTDKGIHQALLDLAHKQAGDVHIAFIPTAANVEWGNKGWLIKDLATFKKLGYRSVDIVDISALSPSIWEPRLKVAQVLCFGGGNTFHLMHWLKQSGLAALLPKLLKTRVYMGISAGSMVASRSLSFSQSKKFYYPDKSTTAQDTKGGLDLVDFLIRPHLNSPYFPKVRQPFIKKLAEETSETVYALDDRTALKVIGKKVIVVGGGKYLVFNQ